MWAARATKVPVQLVVITVAARLAPGVATKARAAAQLTFAPALYWPIALRLLVEVAVPADFLAAAVVVPEA